MPADERQAKPELFLDLIRRQQRGRLKIYLGFAAGVGKTFTMLQEGNRLRSQGVDVVSGFVETHGRAETLAQIGELEQVPRRRIEYRGIVLEEMGRVLLCAPYFASAVLAAGAILQAGTEAQKAALRAQKRLERILHEQETERLHAAAPPPPARLSW